VARDAIIVVVKVRKTTGTENERNERSNSLEKLLSLKG